MAEPAADGSCLPAGDPFPGRTVSGHSSKKLCKPIGNYHTITLDPVLRREDAAFAAASDLIAKVLRSLHPLSDAASALVIPVFWDKASG